MATQPKIFVSYSHEDKEWLERLQVHLKPLERGGTIDLWDDTRIKTGDRWREEIRQAIESSQAAVLLLSADFLASDFIATDELPPLLKAAEDRGLFILPVIVKPFLETPIINQFQVANPEAKPLIDMKEGEREALFVKLARDIQKAFKNPPVNQAPLDQPQLQRGDTSSVKHLLVPNPSQIKKEESVDIFISEAGFNGEKPDNLALVGCVVAEDAELIRQRVEEMRQDLLHDPYIRLIPDVVNRLQTGEFNYSQDDPNVRVKFIETLSSLIFEAYVCYAEKGSFTSQTGQDAYECLFGRLMFERLRANKARRINIWLSQLHQPHIENRQEIVNSHVQAITNIDNRGFQEQPTVELTNGPEYGLAVAHYSCVIVQKYLEIVQKHLEATGTSERLDFERIRNKVRVVHNFTTKEFFTRNNPLP